MSKPCPICGKPVEETRFRPFCSGRCKDVDLGRWLNEVYRVPAPPGGEDEDELPDEPGRPN